MRDHTEHLALVAHALPVKLQDALGYKSNGMHDLMPIVHLLQLCRLVSVVIAHRGHRKKGRLRRRRRRAQRCVCVAPHAVAAACVSVASPACAAQPHA